MKSGDATTEEPEAATLKRPRLSTAESWDNEHDQSREEDHMLEARRTVPSVVIPQTEPFLPPSPLEDRFMFTRRCLGLLGETSSLSLIAKDEKNSPEVKIAPAPTPVSPSRAANGTITNGCNSSTATTPTAASETDLPAYSGTGLQTEKQAVSASFCSVQEKENLDVHKKTDGSSSSKKCEIPWYLLYCEEEQPQTPAVAEGVPVILESLLNSPTELSRWRLRRFFHTIILQTCRDRGFAVSSSDETALQDAQWDRFHLSVKSADTTEEQKKKDEKSCGFDETENLRKYVSLLVKQQGNVKAGGVGDDVVDSATFFGQRKSFHLGAKPRKSCLRAPSRATLRLDPKSIAVPAMARASLAQQKGVKFLQVFADDQAQQKEQTTSPASATAGELSENLAIADQKAAKLFDWINEVLMVKEAERASFVTAQIQLKAESTENILVGVEPGIGKEEGEMNQAGEQEPTPAKASSSSSCASELRTSTSVAITSQTAKEDTLHRRKSHFSSHFSEYTHRVGSFTDLLSGEVLCDLVLKLLFYTHDRPQWTTAVLLDYFDAVHGYSAENRYTQLSTSGTRTRTSGTSSSSFLAAPSSVRRGEVQHLDNMRRFLTIAREVCRVPLELLFSLQDFPSRSVHTAALSKVARCLEALRYLTIPKSCSVIKPDPLPLLKDENKDAGERLLVQATTTSRVLPGSSSDESVIAKLLFDSGHRLHGGLLGHPQSTWRSGKGDRMMHRRLSTQFTAAHGNQHAHLSSSRDERSSQLKKSGSILVRGGNSCSFPSTLSPRNSAVASLTGIVAGVGCSKLDVGGLQHQDNKSDVDLAQPPHLFGAGTLLRGDTKSWFRSERTRSVFVSVNSGVLRLFEKQEDYQKWCASTNRIEEFVGIQTPEASAASKKRSGAEDVKNASTAERNAAAFSSTSGESTSSASSFEKKFVRKHRDALKQVFEKQCTVDDFLTLGDDHEHLNELAQEDKVADLAALEDEEAEQHHEAVAAHLEDAASVSSQGNARAEEGNTKNPEPRLEDVCTFPLLEEIFLDHTVTLVVDDAAPNTIALRIAFHDTDMLGCGGGTSTSVYASGGACSATEIGQQQNLNCGQLVSAKTALNQQPDNAEPNPTTGGDNIISTSPADQISRVAKVKQFASKWRKRGLLGKLFSRRDDAAMDENVNSARKHEDSVNAPNIDDSTVVDGGGGHTPGGTSAPGSSTPLHGPPREWSTSTARGISFCRPLLTSFNDVHVIRKSLGSFGKTVRVSQRNKAGTTQRALYHRSYLEVVIDLSKLQLLSCGVSANYMVGSSGRDGEAENNVRAAEDSTAASSSTSILQRLHEHKRYFEGIFHVLPQDRVYSGSCLPLLPRVELTPYAYTMPTVTVPLLDHRNPHEDRVFLQDPSEDEEEDEDEDIVHFDSNNLQQQEQQGFPGETTGNRQDHHGNQLRVDGAPVGDRTPQSAGRATPLVKTKSSPPAPTPRQKAMMQEAYQH
ncbi:unnamed protein product [Amoebophrya sp. A120]|nr:unnamed protein product [Amoebophrya sp. A120]|eukprot:GSA120T00011540001.1